MSWSDYKIEEFQPKLACKTIQLPEFSDWKCYLFGNTNGISYVPIKGQEPNWFHRKMQTLILGHLWVKKECVTIQT